MESQLERNKVVVQRFNKEILEQGNMDSFEELMDPDFINHSTPAGGDNGRRGVLNTFKNILHPAFPDIRVIIHDQVAEGDLVTTRKIITGTHNGPLMGIAPTGRKVTIDVIDVVRVRNGKYLEHWGVNTMPSVLAELSKG